MRYFVLGLAAVMCIGVTVEGADKKKKKQSAQPEVIALFGKLDANTDGKVDRKEFTEFDGKIADGKKKEKKKEKKKVKAVQVADKKKKKEQEQLQSLSKARDAWFTALDADKNNELTVEEFKKIAEVVKANPIAGKKKKEKKVK